MSMKVTPIELGPKLKDWPLPGKILVTMTVLMLTIGMAGAFGQVVVHDIIPTFWGEDKHAMMEMESEEPAATERGDLFGDALAEPEKTVPKSLHQTDEFIFALKFTHIHVFGMSAIFIVLGAFVLFLDLSHTARAWLIALPFIGIIVDLISVWLKIFIHPGFFWLHIPGGMLFATVFVIETALMLWQMWAAGNPDRAEQRAD